MTKDKQKMILPILICLVLAATNVWAAASTTVGVAAGNEIRYDITGQFMGETVDTGWMKIVVQNVTGTVILGTIEGDGTVIGIDLPSSPQPFSIDVSPPFSSTGRVPGFVFIPANLTAGAEIPGMYTTVSSVTNRYGREAVYVDNSGLGLTSEYWWDRATGVLLEFTTSFASVVSAVKIAETNIWSGGFSFGGLEWWMYVIIIVVVACVLAVAVLMMRRRKPTAAPPTTQAPPPPPPPPPTTSWKSQHAISARGRVDRAHDFS
jgi:hypothetical protein